MVLINQITLTHQQDNSYYLFNQLENHLNAHSGISTVKIKMMAEQLITKELIIRINKMICLTIEQDYKSLRTNHYYKINHGLYSLLQKMTDLETSICFHKKNSEVIVFSDQGFKPLLTICLSIVKIQFTEQTFND